MRPLATWGATRLTSFPDVPTLKELGYDVEYYLWAGLFAPRAVPAAVVKTLREATRQAVSDPEFRSAMDKVQTPIAYLDTDEFKTWWDRDAATLAEVVKKIGRVEQK
jgi:tripartite-type tricarboxylate transporter receptor subunit TctC